MKHKKVFKKIRLSIIIAVFNSHKVVIRQIRHFRNLRLPDDIEIILMDDGSDPPLKDSLDKSGVNNLYIYPTGDKRPWTQGLARNLGAKIAEGEYLFFTDIDHIISKEAIEEAYRFTGDRMVFPREFGILNRRGNVIQDEKILYGYGLIPSHFRKRGFTAGCHTNTFLIKKSIFTLLDGFDPDHCIKGFHVGGKVMSEDRDFYLKYRRLVKAKKANYDVLGPRIFVFPTTRFHVKGNGNPFGLFHNLTRDQK